MKAYNSPTTRVENFQAFYMLMNNVSGGGLQGIHNGSSIPDPIDIY